MSMIVIAGQWRNEEKLVLYVLENPWERVFHLGRRPDFRDPKFRFHLVFVGLSLPAHSDLQDSGIRNQVLSPGRVCVPVRRASRELTNIVAEAEARVSGEYNSWLGNFSLSLFSVSIFWVVNWRRRHTRLRGPKFRKPSPRWRDPSARQSKLSRALFTSRPNYSRLQRLKVRCDQGTCS